WLRTYLSFGPDRPLWCFVADELLAMKAVGTDVNVDEAMRMNAYLQSWAPYQSAADLRTKDLAEMMRVGRKYGITMDAVAVSRELQEEMPIWYHRFSCGDKTLFNANRHVVKCPKVVVGTDGISEKHRIRYVKETQMLARKIGTPRHTDRVDCRCASCQVTRQITGCRHPNHCYKKAQEMLNSLENKWDPRVMQPEDYEEYQEPTPHGEDSGAADFDSRITTKGTLADTFRIFGQGYVNATHTAPQTKFALDQGPSIIVYTDGSAINNNTDNGQAGAGVYFGNNDPRNISIRIPRMLGPSNKVGEIVA
ncbi:hypothetical protein C8R44DRAFT_595815, partial [Mycena epipterygia]